MVQELINEIAAHGGMSAVVPVSRFDDLRRDMEDLRNSDRHAWSDRMLGAMKLPDGLEFEPRSLICVITPSPAATIRFTHRGRAVDCVAPPTYTDWVSKERDALGYINAYLEPRGHKAEVIYLFPQKPLAIHCGLALYGRNNITYSEEFGSFMRVLSFVSDVPCDNDKWLPLRRMEACEKCMACLDACPTGAIDNSSRVIDAARCLTAMNEFPGEFPGWVDKRAHNCIIGCMKCQSCCPGNARNKDNIVRGAEFTEEETAEILAHSGDGPYSERLAAKIDAAGFILPFWPLLPRNLSVLLDGTDC